MTARDTVERLVESRQESTELRSLLEAGIGDDVADYDFARGLETHLAAVSAGPGGGGPAAPAGAGPGASSAAGATSAKALALAIGVPVVSAIAAFVVFATHGPAEIGSAAAPRAASTSVEAVVPAERASDPEAVAPASTAAGADRGSASAPSDNSLRPSSRAATGAQRQAITQSSKVTLAENEAAAPRQATAPGTRDDHPAIHRTFPEGPVESHRATAALPAESTGTAASNTRATAPVPASSVVREEPRPSEEELARAERAKEEARRNAEDTLQREMEELMRAKRALSSDPKLALQLAERGQREFKQSLLSEEREHVLLLALIGVGRVSEAERRAAPYLAKHPDSPFARRVRAALEARKSR
jgi:hypothetical protein